MGYTHEGDEIFVVPGIDATRLTNQDSVCVYTLRTVVASGSEIGVVGAVQGGDSYQDMKNCATPFWKELKELAQNPVVRTDFGEFKVTVRGGGDLSNIFDQNGLGKATSHHSCPGCILPKSRFADVVSPEFPDLISACNSVLCRTRCNIINECRKPKPLFSVKNYPLSPLPLDPNEPLLLYFIVCMLHAIMRIVGKEGIILYILLWITSVLGWRKNCRKKKPK